MTNEINSFVFDEMTEKILVFPYNEIQIRYANLLEQDTWSARRLSDEPHFWIYSSILEFSTKKRPNSKSRIPHFHNRMSVHTVENKHLPKGTNKLII